jgi:hypothetical protein
MQIGRLSDLIAIPINRSRGEDDGYRTADLEDEIA